MILYDLHEITDLSVAWRDEAKYVETWLLMVHKKGLVHVSVRHAYIEKSLAHTHARTQTPREKKTTRLASGITRRNHRGLMSASSHKVSLMR